MMAEILIIGAAIIDVLVRPASASVFETGSYPAEDIRMSPGADALNEALVLARLGRKVKLEALIGDDRAGKFLLRECEESGIVIEKRQIRKEIPTGINVVLVSEDGERSFLTNPYGTLRALQACDIRMPFDREVKFLCFASIFVFPKIGPDELVQIFSQAKRQGITVCADMTSCKCGETVSDMAEAFSLIDYLFANEKEAALLTGEADAEAAAECLLSSGAGHVVIKRGAKGCLVKTKEETFFVPARAGTVCVDTTGAGDSFVAGFIFALSEGRDLLQCAQFANICGGRAAEKLGATAWTADMTADSLSDRSVFGMPSGREH